MLEPYYIGEFWAGAAYGCIEPKEIVEYIIEHRLPWKLNIQAHKFIWSPEQTLV